MKKNIILLVIAFLLVGINPSKAQTTICDCVDSGISSFKDYENGTLTEDEMIKKYEKSEASCSKLITSLGEEKALEAMMNCKNWDEFNSLLMGGVEPIDSEMVCNCVDLMTLAYKDYLDNNISDEKMEEKYGETLMSCEPLFMDQSALMSMMNCDSYAEFMGLVERLMETE